MRPGRRRWWTRTICLVLLWGVLVGVWAFFVFSCVWVALYALSA